MRALDEMRMVIELACLTENRTRGEQSALRAVAHRADAEANAQTCSNPTLKNQPEGPCDFQPGPPETHVKCKCSPAGGVELERPLLVRKPRDGWWRLETLVEQTWAHG